MIFSSLAPKPIEAKSERGQWNSIYFFEIHFVSSRRFVESSTGVLGRLGRLTLERRKRRQMRKFETTFSEEIKSYFSSRLKNNERKRKMMSNIRASILRNMSDVAESKTAHATIAGENQMGDRTVEQIQTKPSVRWDL